MRKRAVLALMLVAALVLASSCSLIVKDAEVDKQTPIIEVLGKTFTKSEVAAQVDYQLAYQQYIYQTMYGYDIDITSDSAISEARETVINALIENAVVEAKAEESGMGEFTEEELAEVNASADTSYQSYVDSVKSGYFADTELTGEELDKAIADKLVELDFPTRDEILEGEKKTKSTEKLKADVVKDVAVTDEDIQAEYDKRVATAMETYATNPGSYGTAITNGTTVYYAPAGYRYVKHILRNFLADDKTKIDEIQAELTEKQTQLTNVEGTLAELGEDATADTEEQAKQRTDLNATKDTLTTETAELQTKLDAAKEAAYAALQPTIDEIQQKLTEGADFDALIEEYGEDPGMKSSPAKENGYPVCEGSTNWVTSFKDAAMALANIGDVSPATRSDYGIHIIKYVGDIAEGATPLSDVKDTISSELLTTKQNDFFTETVATWVEAAGAKVYKDRLAD